MCVVENQRVNSSRIVPSLGTLSSSKFYYSAFQELPNILKGATKRKYKFGSLGRPLGPITAKPSFRNSHVQTATGPAEEEIEAYRYEDALQEDVRLCRRKTTIVIE